MHPEARAYVVQAVAEHGPFASVVEFGSIDINGGVRDLFGQDYTGVDIVDGPGVDVVADVTTYRHPRKVDAVVCCEVLEHTPHGRKVIANAAHLLKSGGVLIVTAAIDPRAPHSAFDGGPVRDDEYYGNVAPAKLRRRLRENFSTYTLDVAGGDIRATAIK